MAAILSSQLDFIFFFYGFAFILLGATCFAVRGRSPDEAWTTLGLFGFVHGASEWLDLTALVLGDTPLFAIARTAVMTVSYVLLLEFARQIGLKRGWKLPGRWIYVPLLLIVAAGGYVDGVTTANALARYFIGLVGALGCSILLARGAGADPQVARRLSLSVAAALALYGIAAGAIVPAAPFWPADVVNHDSFFQLTGIPIQLVRGILACWAAYAVWSIWLSRLSEQVSSERYTSYLRRQFLWTLVAMGTILLCGWTLTEVLGDIYQRNVQQEANGDIDLLSSRLSGETASVEGMVKALAGSRSVRGTLLGGGGDDRERAQFVLNLDVDASGAARGYLLDRDGSVVVSSGGASAVPVGGNFQAVPFFQRAMAGEAGYQFVFDAADKTPDFFASYPVRDADGKVIGAAVMQKSLAALHADLRHFDHPYFLVDGDGVVTLTNRPDMVLHPLWPLSAERRTARAAQSGTSNSAPVVNQQIADATWITINGSRDYARRRYARDGEWSLVMLKPTQQIFASRVVGIAITLLITIMALIYLSGRERSVHDQVQMDKRLQLQDLARNLRFQATTDSLTGLNNRLQFNQALAAEILRSDRYAVPFSVILFDVDHFKRVNDTRGHQTGDRVLIQLARIASERVRNTDSLARWGGEEFVVLLPNTDGAAACRVAEKLRAAIAEAIFEGGGPTTCSFGVAQYWGGDSAEELLARADGALYCAKLNGRDRVELATRHRATMASVA